MNTLLNLSGNEHTCERLGTKVRIEKKKNFQAELNAHLSAGMISSAIDLLLLKLNSVALVRTRTIPTERPPPVGEVSANFCG